MLRMSLFPQCFQTVFEHTNACHGSMVFLAVERISNDFHELERISIDFLDFGADFQ